VAIAKDVRSQVDGIGGQIDLALRIGGFDCQQLVNSYEYVVARHDLTLPPDVAGPYATYQAGINVFIDKVHDLYNDCVFILGAPYYHFIPKETWGLARIGVNDSRDLITQAIVEAGGIP